MVPRIATSSNCSSFSSLPRFRAGCQGLPSEAVPVSGVAYWLRSSATAGISKEVAKTQLRSIERKTLVSYQREWRRFGVWCAERQISYGTITVNDICEFLLFMFKSKTPSGMDYSSGALNKLRSSI